MDWWFIHGKGMKSFDWFNFRKKESWKATEICEGESCKGSTQVDQVSRKQVDQHRRWREDMEEESWRNLKIDNWLENAKFKV